MAGVYLHIPFCKKRCNYCDFYKTTNLNFKTDLISTLIKEISAKKLYLSENKIDTIYFGGGTPSVLDIGEIEMVFKTLFRYIPSNDVTEITFETNPDDFTIDYGKQLKNYSPINRISFGLQSIFDKQLRIIGRRHNANEGIEAIERAHKIGFNNITADLIYGLPDLSLQMWDKTLDVVLNLPIKHLSAYHLTYEEGTPFYADLKKGNLKEIDEDLSHQQFEMLIKKTIEKGMEHYEISNFAYPGFESQHNSNYWTGQPYFGMGPSAHSYYNMKRQWNVSSVQQYIKLFNSDKPYFESEKLSDIDRFNEIVMLGLRTSKGLSLENIKQLGQNFNEVLEVNIEPYIKEKKLLMNNGFIAVTPQYKFITDGIIQNLFIT